MADLLFCPIKINLTLHVLQKRADGYHELRSLFWKKTGAEALTVALSTNGKNSLEVQGAKIAGKNIIDSVLEFASQKITFPPLSIKISKRYPQGSGIGAGSGNAASLLSWLATHYFLSCTPKELASLGADVSVLAQDLPLQFATGIGEILEPLKINLQLQLLLAFPVWSSSTALAYRQLDECANEKFEPLDYKMEAQNVAEKLSKGNSLGLLANDFLPPAMKMHPEYYKIFDIAEYCDTLAWGMCGSGSAAFMLSNDTEKLNKAEYELKKCAFITLTERLD